MTNGLDTDDLPKMRPFEEIAAKFAEEFPARAAEFAEIERLEAEYGSITAAAEAMGIPRSTLWHRLNRHSVNGYRRLSYRSKAEDGRCVACWRGAAPGYVRCESCLDKQAERQAKYWDNLPITKRVPKELRDRRRKAEKRMKQRAERRDAAPEETIKQFTGRVIQEEAI